MRGKGAVVSRCHEEEGWSAFSLRGLPRFPNPQGTGCTEAGHLGPYSWPAPEDRTGKGSAQHRFQAPYPCTPWPQVFELRAHIYLVHTVFLDTATQWTHNKYLIIDWYRSFTCAYLLECHILSIRANKILNVKQTFLSIGDCITFHTAPRRGIS